MLISEMAAVSDCFSIGSIVACTTCFHRNIEGEVLAFDPQTKMLILKCPSSDTSKTSTNDVYIVNLTMCSDVRVIKECSTIPEPPQSLNLQRLSTRVRNAVDQKKRLLSALAAGVSPEGQKLYMVISKTINNEVTWNGANIVVFTDVTITPPYKVENVGGNPDSRQLTYVKKIVEKFVRDQMVAASIAAKQSAVVAAAAAAASDATNASASASSAASSSSSSSAGGGGGGCVGGGVAGGAGLEATSAAAGGGGGSSSQSQSSQSSGQSSSSSSAAPSPIVVAGGGGGGGGVGASAPAGGVGAGGVISSGGAGSSTLQVAAN